MIACAIGSSVPSGFTQGIEGSLSYPSFGSSILQKNQLGAFVARLQALCRPLDRLGRRQDDLVAGPPVRRRGDAMLVGGLQASMRRRISSVFRPVVSG